MDGDRAQDSFDGHSADDFVRALRGRQYTRSEVLKRAAAAGVGLSSAGVLAACFGDSDSASTTATTAEVPAKPGGTMRIAFPASPTGSLDPQAAASLPARLRNSNVFDTLFMDANDGQLVPALAEEAIPNADATQWTIRIRPDVEFHDGSPLTVEDVIFSLKRILDPKTSAEGIGQIGMVDPRGIKKVDKTSLVIPLKYPYSIFPAQLANSHVITIVKDNVKGFDPPIGTGAFRFDSGNDTEFTLARNPNYWQSDKLPRLNTVELQTIQDPTARLNALKTDQVDAIYPVEFTQAAAVKSSSDITTFVNKTKTFMPMYMRSDKPPFSDNKVREALKYATDRETMNELAYGGEGAVGNDMLVPADDPAYPSDAEQRPFDPERAKALWSEAGMAGQKLEFGTSAVWPGQLTAATVYAQKAKDAGIDIEVRKLPDDQFISKIYGVKPFANDYWKAAPPLTIMSLALVPGADYFATTSWANPETTRLYKEAAAETDEAKRNELTAEMMREFAATGPYIVWAFEASPDLYSSRIGGQENSVIRSLNGFRLEKFFIKS